MHSTRLSSERQLTSRAPEATLEFGRRLGTVLEAGDWIGLSGDLGAGKTCLTQGIAAGLGVAADIPITSPTFVLLQSYPGRIVLHHLDLYRLAEYSELFEIGYEELLGGPGACAVEWCDQVPESIPKDGLLIRLRLVDEQTRELWLRALGPRGAALLQILA